MLNRAWPRFTTAREIGIGIRSTGAPFCMPVKNTSSSRRKPRATVPSGIGRDERLSAKNGFAWSGLNRGPSCMSWRHAAVPASAMAPSRAIADARARPRLLLDVIHSPRPEALEQVAGPVVVELRIRRFDAEEQAVLRPALAEALHVEHRVIGLREAAQDQRAEHGGDRREQDRRLERGHDERRQADERPAADVERIAAQVDAADAQVPADHVHVELEAEARQCAGDAAREIHLLDAAVVVADLRGTPLPRPPP